MGRKPQFNWKEVQSYYDSGKTVMQCCRHFGFTKMGWTGSVERGKIVPDPTRIRPKYNPDLNLIGTVVNDITVVAKGNRKSRWTCRCICGKEITVNTFHIRHGSIVSCGCAKERRFSENKHWKGHEEISGSFWGKIKSSAHSRGRPIDFQISIEYAWSLFIKQDRKCAISGVSLSMHADPSKRTASLDRINSRLGYTEDNVQWVHKRINIMKGNLDESDFMNWVRTVYEFKK